jgi:hypothetical protein
MPVTCCTNLLPHFKAEEEYMAILGKETIDDVKLNDETG